PTDFLYGADASGELPRLTVTTEVVEDLGGVSNLLFPVDAKRVVTDATRAAIEDDEGTLLADDQRVRFCAAIQGRQSVAVGQDVGAGGPGPAGGGSPPAPCISPPRSRGGDSRGPGLGGGRGGGAHPPPPAAPPR